MDIKERDKEIHLVEITDLHECASLNIVEFAIFSFFRKKLTMCPWFDDFTIFQAPTKSQWDNLSGMQR